MNGIIAFLTFVLIVAILVFVPTLAHPYESTYGTVDFFYCAKAVGVGAVVALIAGLLIGRVTDHGSYLVKLFMLALIVRIFIGAAI